MGKTNTINVTVTWEDGNFACGWGYPGFGAVLCTSKTLDDIKREFEQSLREQIRGMVADGDELPEWLATEAFTIEYELAVSALLREAARFVSFAAISQATGINQKLLSSYANSAKKPREAQRARIISGLNQIGRALCAVH